MADEEAQSKRDEKVPFDEIQEGISQALPMHTFKPLVRNKSLKAEKDMPLVTIADSIRLINKRDSERALFNLAKQSPWLLDSGTPIMSSPHLTTFPNLEQRRKDQIREHKQRKKDEKEFARMRSASVDQTDGPFLSKVQDEEEQWERKRMMKLSSSETSFANSVQSNGSSMYSPTADMLKELREEFAKASNPLSVSICYGLVNAIIVLPVIMSFGNIIYHDEFFRPYLPVLVKLTVVSGVVHQLCFAFFSTLPFAIGSVQDAGLIFLSTIASNIVQYCKDRGCSDEEILATSLVGLSIFTATLGVGLILIGKLKLAAHVQKLPTSVVGGYLAFIGFFCGQSALCLLSGAHVSGIQEWYKFMNPTALFLMAPGVFGGIGIYCSVRKLKHMAVLPTSITILVAAFYITLYVKGLSLDDAKDIGLMSRADPPPAWYHTWDYIKMDKVVWDALPGQTFTVCSMIFVVALSSSLDIAAIDLEVAKPLAYNYELGMIGISNLVSGLTGGYTGSYIFSQSIFSLRAGIRSRLSGLVAAVIQAISVIMPISILAIVPNFIFASLLIMICVDLMIEWLWDVRKKLSKAEYSVALMTFALIQVLGVAYGIVAGIGYYILLSKIGLLSDAERPESDDAVTTNERSPILKELKEEERTYNSTDTQGEDNELGVTF
jgi:MFS superfamily sulfate permease-like transporter